MQYCNEEKMEDITRIILGVGIIVGVVVVLKIIKIIALKIKPELATRKPKGGFFAKLYREWEEEKIKESFKRLDYYNDLYSKHLEEKKKNKRK